MTSRQNYSNQMEKFSGKITGSMFVKTFDSYGSL